MPFQKDLQEGLQNPLLTQERATSSIPRSAPSQETNSSSGGHSSQNATTASNFWMYPSSQMFYSALKRKGYETDPKDIDTMVSVHNFLNEQVWQDILAWEKPK